MAFDNEGTTPSFDIGVYFFRGINVQISFFATSRGENGVYIRR